MYQYSHEKLKYIDTFFFFDTLDLAHAMNLRNLGVIFMCGDRSRWIRYLFLTRTKLLPL